MISMGLIVDRRPREGCTSLVNIGHSRCASIRSAPLPLRESVARAAPPIRSAPLPLRESVARPAPPIRSAPLPLREIGRSPCASHPLGTAAAPETASEERGVAEGSVHQLDADEHDEEREVEHARGRNDAPHGGETGSVSCIST